MLKKYGQFFISSLFVSDSLIIIFSWLAAYYLRFNFSIFPQAIEVPPLEQYVFPLVIVWIVFLINIKIFDLYRPLKGRSVWSDFGVILKVTTSTILILAAISFFYRGASYSRLTVVLFWGVTILLMGLGHALIRKGFMEMRKKGVDLRKVLIVGAGDLGQSVAEKIDLHPEIGFSVCGYLSQHAYKIGKVFKGHIVLGLLQDVSRYIESERVDQLFIALPLKSHDKLDQVMGNLGEEKVDIKVVPDLLRYMNLSSGVEDFDGLPIVSLTGSPLYGWNIVVKRATDIVCSLFAIVLTSPLMLLIALLIRLESKGSIIFRQDRVGFDGKKFSMLKFRSMLDDAEQATGPVWTKEDDDRRTRLGIFLRKSSLDELPQFFNVLCGEMSLVGPRPERPVFVEDFKKSIPHYMLRLKMKAGLTGWAQVNGWRGNTSLEKRIEYDLYYIKNWSLLFDLKIMVMTLWKGILSRHAY